MNMSSNEKVFSSSRMANGVSQNVGMRWDIRKGDTGEHNFASNNSFGSVCAPEPGKDKTQGMAGVYSQINGFGSSLMENNHGNHDENTFSLWNQGKDGICVEKQLSPTSVSGNGCLLFEDLVSKILDEDNSPQSVSEQGDYFDETFSKNRKANVVEKATWFEGKKGSICPQSLLEASKNFQANARNGLAIPQTHSASDIFNLNGGSHSWKQKSSSDHFIPDFKSESFKVMGEKDATSSTPHVELKNLYGKNNSVVSDSNVNCNGGILMGGSINSGDLAIPTNLNDISQHISLLSIGNQLRNDSKMCNSSMASNDVFSKMSVVTCENSQKYDGNGWFFPLGLSSPDYLNAMIVPTYSVGNKFDGMSSKTAQYVPCSEQKQTWSQKETQCEGINSMLNQGKELNKVVDALSSGRTQCPASTVRPLLKRNNYELESEVKPDVMSIIGGPFLPQDYVHPEAAIYSNHPLVPRFVPLALLNSGVRNGLSQVKMTPIFVNPSQEVGSQQMKSLARRPEPTSMVDYYLDHCFEQLNCLEREESKMEAELCKLKILPDVGMAVANCPRFSHNSSRVNHLVGESLKKHGKINSMLMNIKKMSSHPLHANIYSAMDTWLEGIRKVQARRKEEIVSTANRNNNSGLRNMDDKDNLAISAAIEELLGQTRKTRTALWCAFQMCLFACSSPSGHELNCDSAQL